MIQKHVHKVAYIKYILLAGLTSLVFSQVICRAIDASKPTDAEGDALLAIVRVVNHSALPYKATVLQEMLAEANYSASQLHLPMHLPFSKNDVIDIFIPLPWYSLINDSSPPYFPATIYGRAIANTNIPLNLRLSALKFAVNGRMATTNFQFCFTHGRLTDIMRLSGSMSEYYAHDLDKLVGQSSLIGTNEAYQLATQWLAAVNMDMPAVSKLQHVINQLKYLPQGASNALTLPLFYVDFGSKHYQFAAGSPMKDYDKPQISVEILGTTKELQELLIEDASLSLRPTMIITNALELIRTPQATITHFTNSP